MTRPHNYPQAQFVTATPERADGVTPCARVTEGPSTRWLIEQGYLSPFKYVTPRSALKINK